MSVIAQDVFMIAMNLMEEESQDGTYDGYPEEYKKRAWSILTILQGELLPPSVVPNAVTGPQSVMQVDDRTSINAIPYGLAAHLLLNEDQNKAVFFNSRYDELKRKRPATISKIQDVYGFTKNEPVTPKTVSDMDGGSFLDPSNGEYDGGEF